MKFCSRVQFCVDGRPMRCFEVVHDIYSAVGGDNIAYVRDVNSHLESVISVEIWEAVLTICLTIF